MNQAHKDLNKKLFDLIEDMKESKKDYSEELLKIKEQFLSVQKAYLADAKLRLKTGAGSTANAQQALQDAATAGAMADGAYALISNDKIDDNVRTKIMDDARSINEIRVQLKKGEIDSTQALKSLEQIGSSSKVSADTLDEVKASSAPTLRR